MMFDRFLVRFGSVLAPFLAPKLGQNRLKIASRRRLRRLFLKNADFHADLRFPRFFHQNRPQDEAKIGLRSPQDSPKTVLKSFIFDVEICLRFWSVLGSVLVAFGAPFGSQVGTQIGQKIDLKLQDRSWAILGRSWDDFWAVLGGLGSVLGRFWAVLGRSWALLGRSWALLGRSWGGLGPSWPVLVALGGAVLLCGLCGR